LPFNCGKTRWRAMQKSTVSNGIRLLCGTFLPAGDAICGDIVARFWLDEA